MDANAIFTLSYGLYLLSVNDGARDNACIINTAMQITDQPLRLTLGVNKANHTASTLDETGVFALSVLSQDAGMDLFRHFGFQSGREVDKFASRNDPRASNGLRYLDTACCAVLCGKIRSVMDCGTHQLYLADVTDMKALASAPPMTYAYYHSNVKPRRPAPSRGYTCRICGYHYDGDVLPPDFICPICKHGAEAFQRD